MPVERRLVSTSQLAELLGVEPTRLLDVERPSGGPISLSRRRPGSTQWAIVLEEPDHGTNQPHLSAADHEAQPAAQGREEDVLA
jgi:hypothetical protein